jgi:acetoin utilization protein AcuB
MTSDDLSALFELPASATLEELRATPLESVMQKDVIRIRMDTTLSEAMTICLQHRIRHLPIINRLEILSGIVTDRDLRVYTSHRLGTIMENNSDRETLHRHVHVMMNRRVVTGTPDMTVGEAVDLMLSHHVGGLPVVDEKNRVVGMVTAIDFLALIAGRMTSPEEEEVTRSQEA